MAQRRDSVQFLDPGSVDNSESDSSVGGVIPPSPMAGYGTYSLQPSTNPDENFKVAIRVRPPLPRELDGHRPFVNVVRVPTDSRSITLCEHLESDDGRGGGVYSTQSFTFDRVYGPESTQGEVYESSARTAVTSVLTGYNATVIAYGQTGTGKTFTMEGFTSDDNRGIIPRATEHVFAHIHQQIQNYNGPATQFQVRASYLQIYNEIVSDLLKPGGQGKPLNIRQAKNRVYVDGLSEWVVRSPHEIYGLMERGCAMRATGTTRMSELSSRSHAIFVIIVETIEGESIDCPTSFKVGKLNIVDLAGSEKVRQAGVSGVRLEETKKINWSLHELGNVIAALTDPNKKDRHIPYRNSKLTHLLTDSLGGNCRTTLIACISPALESYSESLSTLKFANRAKNIKNDATVNDDVTDPRALTVKYERELKRLRNMLAEKNGGVMPPGVLDGVVGSLPGEQYPAQNSTGGAGALGERDRNLSDDKRYAWKLQERVRDLELTLQAQGIVVHPDGSVTKSSSSANSNSNAESESEEDKAQVERYKQLLLKQRDIMLNLTTRLNERDESILRLQEEIDAYDSHVQQLEDQFATLQQQGIINGGSNNAGKMYTMEEADGFLASRRVTGRDGVVRFVAETSVGVPDSHAQLLSAEAKIRELLTSGAIPNAAHQPFSSHFQDEATVRDRLEASLRNVLRGKCLSLQQEVHSAHETLRQTEQRLQIAEGALQAAQATHNMDHIKQSLRASLDAALQMKLDRALCELQEERATRQRHATDLERVSTEVQLLAKRLTLAVGREEAEEVQSSVARISDMLRSTEQHLAEECATWLTPLDQLVGHHHQGSAAAAASLSSSSSSSSGQTGQQYQEQIAALQATIDTMRRQQQQQQNAANSSKAASQMSAAREGELLAQLEERSKAYRALEGEYRQVQQQSQAASGEVQNLRKSLATHTKDRRALRTILDSRIKVKVENVLLGLSKGGDGSMSNDKYMRQELTALQNLVNASIAAMDADNP